MKYFYALRDVYVQYYLLAASASILLVGFFGSINVLLIAMEPVTFLGMLGLLLTITATMRFLAFFLAQFPKNRIFESFVSGIVIQLLILMILSLN